MTVIIVIMIMIVKIMVIMIKMILAITQSVFKLQLPHLSNLRTTDKL